MPDGERRAGAARTSRLEARTRAGVGRGGPLPASPSRPVKPTEGDGASFARSVLRIRRCRICVTSLPGLQHRRALISFEWGTRVRQVG